MFTKLHERRVEKLAQAVENSKTYDQTRAKNDGQDKLHPRGSPGCMIGHAAVVFKKSRAYKGYNLRGFLFGDSTAWDGPKSVSKAFMRDVFGVSGCGRAGKNAKKAAKYLRKVAADIKAGYARARLTQQRTAR